MGVLMRTVQFPYLVHYEREYNEDGSEKHIHCDGARFHVISYRLTKDGYETRCSEPNCEVNKK